MLIKETELAVPIIKIDSKVTHSTRRKSTAIEWVILELISRFQTNPHYNQVSLKKLFEHILSVPDSDKLIKPVLEKLIDLQIVQCNCPLTSLEEVTLSNVTMSSQGRKVQKLKVIPTNDRSDAVTHYYDYFSNQFLKDNETRWMKEEPLGNFVHMTEANLNVYPHGMIQQDVESSPAKFEWFKENTDINDISKMTSKLMWKTIKVNIQLNERQEAIASCSDSAYTERMPEFESFADESLYESLLAHFPINDDLAFASLQEFQGLAMEMKILDDAVMKKEVADIGKKLSLPAIHIVQADMIAKYYPETSFENLIVNNKKLPKNSLVFLISPKESFQVYWNERNNGAIVTLPSFFQNNALYVNSFKDNVMAVKTSIHVEGEQTEVPIRYSLIKDEVNLQDIFDELEQQIRNHGNYQALLLLAFWKRPQEVWHSIVSQLEKSSNIPLKEKVEVLGQVQKWLKEFCKPNETRHIAWEKAKLDLLKGAVLGAATVEKLIELAAELPLHQYKDLSQEVAAKVIQSFLPIESLAHLQELHHVLQNVNIDSHAKILPFTAELYSDAILQELFFRFDEVDWMQTQLVQRNELENALRELVLLQKKLVEELNWNTLATEKTEAEMKQLLPVIDYQKVMNDCVRWNDLVAKLKKMTPYVQALEKTTFGLVDDSVRKLDAFLQTFNHQAPKGYEAVYVLDTSVLMSNASVFEYITKKDYLVICSSHEEELFKMLSFVTRQQPNLTAKMDDLSFALKERSFENITFEDYHPAVLPADVSLTLDNQLLSLALKYKASKPSIITTNINLKEAATTYGIQVIDPADLAKKKAKTKGKKGKSKKR